MREEGSEGGGEEGGGGREEGGGRRGEVVEGRVQYDCGNELGTTCINYMYQPSHSSAGVHVFAL